jgi:hypothetical protein
MMDNFTLNHTNLLGTSLRFVSEQIRRLTKRFHKIQNSEEGGRNADERRFFI